jgi:Ku protein
LKVRLRKAGTPWRPQAPAPSGRAQSASGFVEAADIPATYFQKPYYVAPVNKGQKAYLLLRDTLRKTGKAGLARPGKAGLARVVISTRQHLAALVPFGDGLALNLLRWADEIRDFPASVMLDADTPAPTARELKMAEQLVNDMADAWSPSLFHDEFKEKLDELLQRKARAGDVATVQPLPGEEVAQPSAEVIDLTELLKRSLKGAPLPTMRRRSSSAPLRANPRPRRELASSPRRAASRHRPPTADRPLASGQIPAHARIENSLYPKHAEFRAAPAHQPHRRRQQRQPALDADGGRSHPDPRSRALQLLRDDRYPAGRRGARLRPIRRQVPSLQRRQRRGPCTGQPSGLRLIARNAIHFFDLSSAALAAMSSPAALLAGEL